MAATDAFAPERGNSAFRMGGGAIPDNVPLPPRPNAPGETAPNASHGGGGKPPRPANDDGFGRGRPDPSGRLARIEPLVHSSIPLLVVVFLFVIAMLRGVVLLDMRAHDLDVARDGLAISAELVEHRHGADLREALDGMAQAQGTVWSERSREAVGAALADARASLDGVGLLLVGREGTIIADSGEGFAGRPLDAVVPDGMLRALGAPAGVRDVRVDGVRGIALVRDLRGGDRLIAHRSHDHILADWREHVSANAGMFTLMVVVLIVFLLAYFVQAARVREREEYFCDNQRRMDGALGRGRCGLWEWDIGNATVRWSRSMYEMLGLDVPEGDEGKLSVGQMRSHLHPEDDRLFDIARSAAERRLDRVDEEFRMRHRETGEWVWLRARCRVERNARGQVRLTGIAMDVTAQRELEDKERAEALRRRTAEARFADAVRSINEAFVLWDANDRLVACNDKFREWLDLPGSRTRCGTPRNEVLPSSFRSTRTRELGKMSDEEREAGRPYEVRLAGGRWLQVSEQRMEDGCTAVIGTDITLLRTRTDEARTAERRLRANLENLRQSEKARKQREKELEAMTAGYRREKEAAERAVAEADEARRHAEEASQSKSAFLASMSHELRTPLNAIIGFSDMMNQGAFGPLGGTDLGSTKYAEYASDIHHAAVHLLDVIGDILDMSKIEAGRFDLEREEVDICPMVQDAVRTLSLRAEQKGIAVDTAITNCLSVDADQRALKQVLLNLLSNALKFTPEGGRIRVSARRRAGHMRLAISDTGVGIPPGDVERVLRPFEQVGDIHTRPHEGSGLGLAISRALVELHGGRLSLRSTLGEGTTVAVTLPLVAEAGEDAAAAA